MVCVLQAQALSLSEAVVQGLAVNPQVGAAESDVRVAATEVDIARDSYWPSVEVSAGPENSLMGEFGYDVTATQVLYDWGRIASQVASASAEYRHRLASLKVTSDEVALDIIELYLDVVAAQRRVVEVEGYLGRLEALAAMTDQRDLGGYSDRSESERSRLDIARAREQLAMERGGLREARQELRVLLQRDILATQMPDPEDYLASLAAPAQVDRAIEDAPVLEQSEADVSVAKAELEESGAALMPQLNLEGSLLRREVGGVMEEDQVIALRVRMEPIQGLSNWRRTDAAAQRVESSQFSRRATQRDLQRTIAGLKEQYQVTQWRLEGLEEQIDRAGEVLATYEDQFSVGLRDIADLLSIESERFEAARQRIDVEIQQLRLQYRAASQLGTLAAVVPRFEEQDIAQGG
ncbi:MULTISPECIES: TolC family protein [unclassified Halomonas]|uniref:TolC family protein n=1 Tax=unclassified Halomonas TaxID=2609666 RepID=UPI0028850C07|nr:MULTISPECIES: TolC family protein [unclassified Halomonas]MDT0501134.1 TolC family protein [Halomonas sp. PAR7]MDT0513325.1 TolC family protein [Halomonas sp. LES1]MDT0592162.1 TolC family protein [Halomonas sp. PAR8]